MISGIKKKAPVSSYHFMAPVEHHAASLMHLGIMPDGAVAAIRRGNMLILMSPSWERAAKARECLAWIMKKLPGFRPPHKIVATLGDGMPLSVCAAEMVYNDACFVDSICGDGFYEKLLAGRREVDALLISRRLFAQPNLVTVSVNGAGKGERSALAI